MPKRSSSPRDVILGLLFFGGLFALGYVTMMLRQWPGTGSRQYLNVLFEDVYGIRKEDSVQVHGTRYGRVSGIQPIAPSEWNAAGIDLEGKGIIPTGSSFIPNVLVMIELEHEIDLHDGYRISATDSNILGGKVVDIAPGDPAAPTIDLGMQTDDVLSVSSPEDLRKVTLVGHPKPHPIAALGKMAEDNMDNVNEFIDNLVRASRSLVNEEDQGAIGYLLTSKEAADNVQNIVEGLNDLATRSGQPDNLVYDLFHDSPLRADANQLVSDARNFVEKANDPESLIGSLVATDSKLKRDIDSVVQGASELVDKANNRPDSMIGRLLDDSPNSLGSKADRLITRVDDYIREGVNNPESLLYKISYGDLGTKAQSALDSMGSGFDSIQTALVDPIRNGDGLLGYVVNDPESKRKFIRMVDATLGIVEDAREAAPITSLGSFIFGGF